MCGIVGGIGQFDGVEEKLVNSIDHRGPDSKGTFQEENIFLGHTRLSIQDLSVNGNQPMFSSDKRYVLIFNGEIYNHRDLREALEKKYQFNSTADTETLLYGFIEFGVDVLKELNGIFSFALYDREQKEITIARDQIGVKPLYIYQDDHKLLFSSEVKSFLSLNIDKTIDHEALSNYLTFLWSPGEAIPFKKVRKLLPGHYLKFNRMSFKEARPVQYYDVPVGNGRARGSEESLVDQLEDKLTKAMERQMLSDAPIGFFLSGGLDSTLLVAIARKLRPEEKLQCYTIETTQEYAGEGFTDDLHYAKTAANHLDVDLHVVKADIDIVRDFDKMIWHLDEPQSDAAPLNVLNICALAKEHGIKVMIGGAGGDDLFSGYRRHQALAIEKYIDSIPLFWRTIGKGIGNIIPPSRPFLRRSKKILSELDKTSLERVANYFTWLPREKILGLFQSEWKEKLECQNPVRELLDLNDNLPADIGILDNILYWEMKSFLVDQNLNYTDKLSMAVGVEARVPYLDLELIEFATQLPPEMKMKGRETKYILKKVAERYLPEEIIYRPKTGFGAPVRKWITNDLDVLLKEYLSREQIEARGIFNYEKVWELITENKKGKIDASYSVWCLLAIESWMRQFHDN